jgi:prevent-host-death family protein
MKTVGLFEAKTKFSELCRKVSQARQSIVVTHRGKPLVKIEPIETSPAKKSGVWDARLAYDKKHGLPAEEFEAPARSKARWQNPLDE